MKKNENAGSLKLDRIEQKKRKIGSRNDRHLGKYSDKYNKMFNFYLDIYRSGICTFCGQEVNVDFDINKPDGKFSFREFDNGRFKNINPTTRHPNILKAVIIGKKSWGLLIKEWGGGIGSGLFTKYEFFELFKSHNIIIPDSLLIEFNNLVDKERLKRDEEQKIHYKFLHLCYKNRNVG